MKKLIFLRDGEEKLNYVWLYDTINTWDTYNLDIWINEHGYKKAVDFAEKFNCKWFLTTCPTMLHSINWWNEEEQKFEIYIPTKKGKLKNIQEFTDRELRQAHNVEKLFLGGEFDD